METKSFWQKPEYRQTNHQNHPYFPYLCRSRKEVSACFHIVSSEQMRADSRYPKELYHLLILAEVSKVYLPEIYVKTVIME